MFMYSTLRSKLLTIITIIIIYQSLLFYHKHHIRKKIFLMLYWDHQHRHYHLFDFVFTLNMKASFDRYSSLAPFHTQTSRKFFNEYYSSRYDHISLCFSSGQFPIFAYITRVFLFHVQTRCIITIGVTLLFCLKGIFCHCVPLLGLGLWW